MFGLSLGVAVAYLIARGSWLYAAALAVAIPLGLLFISHPFSAVVIWLIIIPFINVLPDPDNLYWAFHRLMIPACLGLAALSQAFGTRKRTQVRLGPAELAMAVFLVLVVVSIVISQQDTLAPVRQRDAVAAAKSPTGVSGADPLGQFREAADRILIPFCLYLLLRFAAPREKATKVLVATAFFVALSQSMIGLAEMFVPQMVPAEWLSSYGTERTVGSVLDPNLFTTMLVFCIVLLFHSAMNHKPGLVRYVLLLVCGLSIVNVLFSFSRGSWLGGVFVMIGLLILYPKPMLRLIGVFAVIMIVLGTSVFSRQIAWAYERMQVERTIDDRLVIDDALLQMFERKPLFGWGYETVDRYSMQFYRTVGDAPVLDKYLTSHNTYLTIMAELGLFGLFIYLFPFVYWLVNTIRVWPRLPKAGLRSRLLLIALWLAVMYEFIVANTMDMRFFSLALGLWWMTLALIADLVYPYIKPGTVQSIRSATGRVT